MIAVLAVSLTTICQVCHRSVEMLLLLIACVFIKPAASAPNYEYCELRCTTPAGHENSNIACSFYRCLRQTRGCKEIKQHKDEFREHILNRHNEFRNMVANGKILLGGRSYTVSNMNALNYDFDLEYMAQCLANKCSFGDRCLRTKKHEFIGSNVAYMYEDENDNDNLTVAEWVAFTKNWWDVDAFKSFDKDLIAKYSFKTLTDYDHLSRMGNSLWAETTSIGCGRSSFNRAPEWLPKYRMVCAYAPAVQHEKPMFKLGAACTECPSGTKCNTQYDSLCGEVILKPVDNYSNAAITRIGRVVIMAAVLCSNLFPSI